MKRILLFAALVVLALPLFAFDANRAPLRIGLLRVDLEDTRDVEVAESITKSLRDELRAKGFDAFDVDATYDGVIRSREDGEGPSDVHDGRSFGRPQDDTVDYYVEILGADAYGTSRGGVDVGGNHVGVSIEMMTARVAAEVRVYDAHTLEVIESATLAKKKNAVVPASIGIGGRSFYAILAAPLQRLGTRNAAQAVARQAASLVAEALAER